MGMDLDGQNSDSKAGEYFQCSVWTWRPIHRLMAELCYPDLLDADILEHMCYNNGYGPEDQKTCTAIAQRINNWLEHHTDGVALGDSELQVNSEGRFLCEEEIAATPKECRHSPYQVDDNKLKRFVEFLQHCGGFEVF